MGKQTSRQNKISIRPDTRPIPVADGWAGAEMCVFTLSNSITTDRPTNGRMDGRTDRRTKWGLESRSTRLTKKRERERKRKREREVAEERVKEKKREINRERDKVK